MSSRNQIHQVIVLKSQVSGEIHRSLTFFSLQEGIIFAMAHGTQKVKSKLRAFTEAFGRYTAYLYYNPVKNQYKLNDGEDLRAFEAGHRSIEKFYTASLFAEIILKSYGGGTGHEEIYELLSQSLEILGEIGEARRIYLIIQFVYRFLLINGFFMDLDVCDQCGRSIRPGESLIYHHQHEGFFCVDCQHQLVGDFFFLPPGSIKYLGSTPDLDLKTSLEISLEKDTGEKLKNLLLSRLQGLLESPLNSLKQSKEFL